MLLTYTDKESHSMQQHSCQPHLMTDSWTVLRVICTAADWAKATRQSVGLIRIRRNQSRNVETTALKSKWAITKCRTSRFATVWTVLNMKRALTPFDLIACHVVTATRLTWELFVLCAVNKQPTMPKRTYGTRANSDTKENVLGTPRWELLSLQFHDTKEVPSSS